MHRVADRARLPPRPLLLRLCPFRFGNSRFAVLPFNPGAGPGRRAGLTMAGPELQNWCRGGSRLGRFTARRADLSGSGPVSHSDFSVPARFPQQPGQSVIGPAPVWLLGSHPPWPGEWTPFQWR